MLNEFGIRSPMCPSLSNRYRYSEKYMAINFMKIDHDESIKMLGEERHGQKEFIDDMIDVESG